MTFLVLMVSCAVACEGQAPAEPSPSEPPVSLERIQERLKRPAALQLPAEREADFRATVTEDYTRPETLLEAVRRELSGDSPRKRIVPGNIAPPLVTVDLLRIAMSLKQQLSAARRARAERNARSDVEEALAEFCASHDCSILERELEGSKPEGILTR
jgi:hypothetical protein